MLPKSKCRQKVFDQTCIISLFYLYFRSLSRPSFALLMMPFFTELGQTPLLSNKKRRHSLVLKRAVLFVNRSSIVKAVLHPVGDLCQYLSTNDLAGRLPNKIDSTRIREHVQFVDFSTMSCRCVEEHYTVRSGPLKTILDINIANG
ncbi:protein lin-31 [Biomphalaria glabrata]|nr:protein lin-31 [Biomphalaria glabrata]